MESDARYYQRRLAQELDAARRAVTAEAASRRLLLADSFRKRLAEIDAEDAVAA